MTSFQDEVLSKGFNEAHQRYGASKRELWGLLWTLKTLAPFMTQEVKTCIYTDCKAVVDIVRGLGTYNKLLTTWGLIISGFPVEVFWIRGTDNLADQPSRDIFSIEEEDDDTLLYNALKSGSPIPNERKWVESESTQT